MATDRGDELSDLHDKGEQDSADNNYDPPRAPDFLESVLNTDEVNDKMWEEREASDKGWENDRNNR
jgi:hypothetical protein